MTHTYTHSHSHSLTKEFAIPPTKEAEQRKIERTWERVQTKCGNIPNGEK